MPHGSQGQGQTTLYPSLFSLQRFSGGSGSCGKHIEYFVDVRFDLNDGEQNTVTWFDLVIVFTECSGAAMPVRDEEVKGTHAKLSFPQRA